MTYTTTAYLNCFGGMRKKPWNLINVPVYSLCTQLAGNVNMNICTYVTPISMHPKRYAVGIYEGTQTLINMQGQDKAVLQLLGKDQLDCVRTLGLKSGLQYNKYAWLKKKQLTISWNNFEVLQTAAAWILLHKIDAQVQGDHVLHLFDVEAYQANHDQVLMLDHLREKKLIRI